MRISIILIVTLVTFTSRAMVITWTNTGNGNWSATNNWNPNQAPSTNDIAVITNGGTYTVTLNVNPTIAGLSLGGLTGTQTLATAGHTLTLNGDGSVGTNGALLLSGGSLSGYGQIDLDGTITWNYGSIDTNAEVTVSTHGRIFITSGVNHAKYLDGRVSNNGIITWQPTGTLNFSGNLHNLADGIFEIQVDNTSILLTGTNAALTNDGLIRKLTGSRAVNCYIPFLNNGTVNVETGSFDLEAPSVFNAGSAFTGAGKVNLPTATNTLNGAVYSENLALLYGATLTGTGSISGTLTWGGGTIGPDAAITVATNGQILIGSASQYSKFLNGRLTNEGTILWTRSGNLVLEGTLHNRSDALLDIQTGDSLITAGTNPIFVNDGVLRRSIDAATTTWQALLVNNGVVQISSGKLACTGGFSNSAGTIFLAGGTFQNAEPVRLSDGLLTGWGTMNADVINAGCVRPSSSNGVLTINGAYNQTLNGRMEFELAGNSPGTNQSRLNVNGLAALAGTMGVIWSNGFVPAPGMSFPVLTFASRSGEFGGYDNCILLGQGRRLEPVYAAATFSLASVDAPEPTGIPLSVHVDDYGALIHWPQEFSGYGLYWSTNLARTNWTLISDVTNCFIEPSPLAPEKYFRLRPR